MTMMTISMMKKKKTKGRIEGLVQEVMKIFLQLDL